MYPQNTIPNASFASLILFMQFTHIYNVISAVNINVR